MTQTLQVCDLHGKQWHDRGQCERCREEADLTVFSTKDLDKLRERVMMTGPELVAAAPSAELLADLISGKARAEDTSHYVREHVCEPEEKPDGWTGTWCPQCGEGVGCDEEGLCNSCGATCVGEGVEAALKCKRELEVIAKDLDDLGVQRSTTPMDGGEPSPIPTWSRVMLVIGRVQNAERELQVVTVLIGELINGTIHVQDTMLQLRGLYAQLTSKVNLHASLAELARQIDEALTEAGMGDEIGNLATRVKEALSRLKYAQGNVASQRAITRAVETKVLGAIGSQKALITAKQAIEAQLWNLQNNKPNSIRHARLLLDEIESQLATVCDAITQSIVNG